MAARMLGRGDNWMRPAARAAVPAEATERQRRSPGVTELRRASLGEHGASVVVSAGSVLDFGGGTDWAPGTVAIVNAANCGGLGGGGVDGAITGAGGPQLAADRRAMPILAGTRNAQAGSTFTSFISKGAAGVESWDGKRGGVFCNTTVFIFLPLQRKCVPASIEGGQPARARSQDVARRPLPPLL